MDETGLKSLLERLPVSWWEADGELRVIDSGGGAFGDRGTAQRFLDTLRRQPSGPRASGPGHWQTQFDGRLFEVNWCGGVPRQGRSRGVAVEIGTGSAADRRYDAFADLAPSAAFIRDAAGRYVWVNHAYAHLYGTTPEHIIGKHVEEVDSPVDAAQVLALDKDLLTRGKPVRHTLTYHRPDGSSGQAAGHRFPVQEGTETCVAGIYIDISDYTRALHQRREAEESLCALRDHSGLPCALISAGGRIQQASAAAAELLQIRLSDLVGRRADGLLAATSESAGLWRSWRDLIVRRYRRIQTSVVLVDTRGRQRRVRLHLTTVGRYVARATSIWAVVTHQGIAQESHLAMTASQERILSLLAAGRSNADIATSLRLSRQTVDYHLSRLRDLLDAPNRCALVARAYALGIFVPHSWPPRPATAVPSPRAT
ncbi:helix-turn-helix transcriptional regulator [Streptomyces gilvosporeus]|uniref:Histidine kinase n=1 Tax=Streptomyces gilvosporeus TaxID=553510 RepID=A0A1V0TL00_9ACTN|nr:PAS domain S-box protein [Streptomyces gilvosporeus]ARF53550.1 hypothetical protein B1H19_04600 [Streptomyces gilvosporeus]